MKTVEETRLFKLTEDEAAAIREGMAGCDGEWDIAVRTGENWTPDNSQSLLSKDSVPVYGIAGYDLGMFFQEPVTRLGNLKVLSPFGGLTHLDAGDTVEWPPTLSQGNTFIKQEAGFIDLTL
jgi:hypothetical protein